MTIEELISMGFDNLDQISEQMEANMSPQLMEKIKNSRKKKKNKNKNKNKTTTEATTANTNSNADRQQQFQKLIEQMQQHLQQQGVDFKANLPQYGTNEQPVYGSNEQPVYGSNELPVYGSNEQPVYGSNEQPVYGSNELPQYGPTSRPANELPQYGPTLRPATVTFASNNPVSASFPYTPIQTTPTPRPIQTQYVSTTSYSGGLPEYTPGLSQYGSNGFQNDLSQYNRPSTSRPNIISTSSPIEQAQYNIVSTPSQVQYSQNLPQYSQNLPQYNQNLPQYSQNDDLPQYFGNQPPSNFRGSPAGESWFPVNQNQDQYQSTYTGSATPSPTVFTNSKPVRFPSGSNTQQYSSISRNDPYEVIHYDDEDDDWYDPLTHSYHQPSMASFDKSSGPLVPPPTYGKNHLQSLESNRPSINIIAELAKYSNKKNILDQGKLPRNPYIISDPSQSSDTSEIIMYPSGKLFC